jgi:catechol 2,3-dioxygenase-like lactoylglutathione lyase family enzyme
MGDVQIRDVGAVMLPVADQDLSAAFFVEKLGFEKRVDVAFGDGERWVEVAAPGGACAIALTPPRDGQPAGGWSRIAFSTDDVRSDRDAMAALGVDVDAAIIGGDGPVPEMFFFRDPDGNSFLLVQRS